MRQQRIMIGIAGLILSAAVLVWWTRPKSVVPVSVPHEAVAPQRWSLKCVVNLHQ